MTDDTKGEGDALEVEAAPYERIPHWLLFHPDMTANAVRLYLTLGSYAMGTGRAFPSRRTLAKRMGVSVPTVDAAKDVLIACGGLEVQSRVNDRGDQRSNLYLLRWSNNLLGGKESLPPRQRNLGTEANTLEADIIRDTRSPVRKPVDTDDFNEFWSVYPRKESKGQARLAWARALRKATPSDIIQGAARYRDDPNREGEFTAHAATWLNGERWLDDPLPQREGRGDKKLAQVQDLVARAAARDAQRDGKAIES